MTKYYDLVVIDDVLGSDDEDFSTNEDNTMETINNDDDEVSF